MHRDLKPDNFCIGLGKNQNLIYALDFGLTKSFIDPATNKHIAFRDGKLLTGTAKFVSVNTHLGLEQSRRDDLEGIAYILIYFMKGDLPWHGIRAENKTERYNKIMECKMRITIEELCQGIPPVFSKFLYYCRGLKFDEAPDYSFLKDIFKEYFHRKQYGKGFDFDWIYLSNDGSDQNIKMGEENQNIHTNLTKFVQGIKAHLETKNSSIRSEKHSASQRENDSDATNKLQNGAFGYIPKEVIEKTKIKRNIDGSSEHDESCNLKPRDILEDISVYTEYIPSEEKLFHIKMPRRCTMKRPIKWGSAKIRSQSKKGDSAKRNELDLLSIKKSLTMKSQSAFRSQFTMQSTTNTHGGQ